MATVKGKQYYLNDGKPSERKILEWLENIKRINGNFSQETARLLCAGLFLECLEPNLVDFLKNELDKENPDLSFSKLEKLIAALSSIHDERTGDKNKSGNTVVNIADEETDHLDKTVAINADDTSENEDDDSFDFSGCRR